MERPGQRATGVDLHQACSLDVHRATLATHDFHHGVGANVKRPRVLPNDARRTTRLKRQGSGEPPLAGDFECRTFVNTDTAGVCSGEHLTADDDPGLAALVRAVGVDEDAVGVFVILSRSPTLSTSGDRHSNIAPCAKPHVGDRRLGSPRGAESAAPARSTSSLAEDRSR